MTTPYTWVNIVHCYQPPTIEPDVLATVVRESYDPFFHFLYNNPHIKQTLNINSCLTHLLDKHGHSNILDLIKLLVERGQVELMDSAAFHPLLPLINEDEVRRQIKVNQNMNHERLGVRVQPAGFFLPECAYSESVARIVKEMGYTWIVLDELSYNGTVQSVDPNTKHVIKNIGLTAVFRDHNRSRTYVPKTIAEELEKNTLPNTILTATDGELYWHRHKDMSGRFFQITQDKRIATQTVSEHLATCTKTDECTPVASHWDAHEQELTNNIPYSLWQHPDNAIHKALWKLADLAYDTLITHTEDNDFWSARLHFERGISSCTFWWASAQDLSLFDMPAWKPDEVEKGALELIRVIRTLQVPLTTKLAAEKDYLHIKQLIWTTHWINHAKQSIH